MEERMNKMDSAEAPHTIASLTLSKQCYLECEAMAKHALASGLEVSGSLLQQLKELEPSIESADTSSGAMALRRLGECHRRLAKLVAPATPRTILLLHSENEQRGILRFLGPVPIIRQMMVTALISLTALICLTLSSEVNGSKANSDILAGSGVPLLLNELFLLSAAALGASFSALFMANRYIQEGTFDPKYNISYWIRFVLGVIAGFILATLIDLDALDKTRGAGSGSDASSAFARPLLAMIGGFSAAVVYRILSRLADTVESLFRGDLREQVKSQTEAERLRVNAEAEQGRTRLAYRLMALQKKISEGDPSEKLQGELDSLLRELSGMESATEVGAIAEKT
jgi:hypothetical protein